MAEFTLDPIQICQLHGLLRASGGRRAVVSGWEVSDRLMVKHCTLTLAEQFYDSKLRQ